MATALALAMLLVACEEEKKEAEEEAPPPKSANELYQEITKILDPLRAKLDADQGMGKAALDPLVAEARTARQKMNAEPNGKEALARFTQDVDGLIRTARQKERWMPVIKMCELYDILEPGNSKTGRMIEMAERQINRPKVRIKGFVDDMQANDTYVFLEVKVPDAEWFAPDPVREGDEFLDPPYTLRFQEIIGRNKGIRLEYLAVKGDTFDIMKD